MEETRPVLVVRDSVEGEYVCEELRAAGIKCACVEVPSEFSRNSPLAALSPWSPRLTDWAVVVHESDVDRARGVIAKRPES